MKYTNIISEIKNKKARTVSKSEIYDMYLKMYSSSNIRNFDNLIAYLKRINIIENISKDKYYVRTKSNYMPIEDKEISKIINSINNEYPDIKFSIYNTNIINEFTQHYAINNYIIIEIDKIAIELVINLLKEKYFGKYTVITQDMFINNEQLFLNNEKIIVVKPIVQKAPLMNNIFEKYPTIEKIMVDLYVDKLYIQYQGKELEYIYKNIFSKYDINLKKLFSYASIRTDIEKYKKFIKRLNVINDLLCEE